MPASILIAEDEESIALVLKYNLESEGYQVETAYRGDDAEIRILEKKPDLLILDWMLPGLSGIELCRRLRAHSDTERLPILMLTARGEENDRVRGLSVGADDYVVKPFSVPELVARVRSLMRRISPELMSDMLHIGDIYLDRQSHRVRRGEVDIHLGPTEYRLLEFLMQSPGRVFSREQLLNNVWGHDIYVDERTVDVHVGRLRKALKKGHSTNPIRTVRGAGYAFDDQYHNAPQN
jgi:two-component system phosphate regulon response regulator PhoB